MQVDNYDDEPLLEIMEASPRARKFLSYLSLTIGLLSAIAQLIGIWYEASVSCQSGARGWIGFNLLFSMMLLGWIPFKATLHRSICRRVMWLCTWAVLVCQLVLGFVLIAKTNHRECMMESLNGAFMGALLGLDMILFIAFLWVDGRRRLY